MVAQKISVRTGELQVLITLGSEAHFRVDKARALGGRILDVAYPLVPVNDELRSSKRS